MTSLSAPRTTGGMQLSKHISLIAERIASSIESMASYYAAATMYEQLSRLSDAELQRRGLSRDKLARDVSACRAAINIIPE
jgi:hypothetical protein